MQYRSQSGVKWPCKLARRLLQWMHEAQAMGTVRRDVLARSWARSAPVGAQRALREKPNGQSDTNRQQQELFVVVAARLALDQVFRAGVRRNRYRAGRCVGAGRNPAAVVLDPGAMSAARGRYRMGYAGDRGISQRDRAGRRPAAG